MRHFLLLIVISVLSFLAQAKTLQIEVFGNKDGIALQMEVYKLESNANDAGGGSQRDFVPAAWSDLSQSLR